MLKTLEPLSIDYLQQQLRITQHDTWASLPFRAKAYLLLVCAIPKENKRLNRIAWFWISKLHKFAFGKILIIDRQANPDVYIHKTEAMDALLKLLGMTYGEYNRFLKQEDYARSVRDLISRLKCDTLKVELNGK